jgi:hypothetical protein
MRKCGITKIYGIAVTQGRGIRRKCRCTSIRSMTYSRDVRNMEVQRAWHNKLFIFSKRCCLP